MMKKKIIKYLLVIILIASFTFVYIEISKHNESFDIQVKKVDEINSELYDLVTLYEYNESLSQYVIQYKYIKKEYVIYDIFEFYNKDLIYSMESFKLEDDNLIIKLDNLDNEINEVYTFKKMKLSFKSININKLIKK